MRDITNKRRAILDETQKDFEAASAGKTSPKQKEQITKPTAKTGYLFRSQIAKSDYLKSIQHKLDHYRKLSEKSVADSAKEFYGFKVGDYGTLHEKGVGVVKIVDAETVVIRSFDDVANKSILLVVQGVTTSRMSDDSSHKISGTFYVSGNKNVDGKTMLKLIPIQFTKDEEASILKQK